MRGATRVTRMTPDATIGLGDVDSIDLSPGDKVDVDSADLGSFTMTFTGWGTDGSGRATLSFRRDDGVALPLYPAAFHNGVDVGIYTVV